MNPLVGIIGPLAVVYCAAPLAMTMPFWALAFAGLLLSWAAFVRRLALPPLPSRPIKLLLVGGFLVLLQLQGGGLTRFAALAGLVTVVMALFFATPSKPRDAVQLAILCAVLLFIELIVSPSGAMFAHALGGCVVVAVVMTSGAAPSREETGRLLGRGVVFAFLGVPVAVFLAFVLPRFNGWFGGVFGARRATVGFSDDLSPGEVARLAQSDAVAFRVRFLNGAPKFESLYWRGALLWDTDGFNWYNAGDLLPQKVWGSGTDKGIVQEIFLEPHSQRVLFALDKPVLLSPHEDPDSIVGSEDFVFERKSPVMRAFSYRAVSQSLAIWSEAFESEPIVAMDAAHRAKALFLPHTKDAAALALVKTWTDGGASSETAVSRALAYFASGEFVYTLRPGRVSGLENFLENKRGFCGHYASAFAVLMRLAGIPARVVTGYQGGEYNAWGRYWIVRQNDAHVWVEVWLEDRGWVRVDPTAVVAPERLSEVRDEELDWLSRGMNGFSLAWDGFRFTAVSWLLGAGDQENESQVDEANGFAQFSFQDGQRILITLVGLFALWMIVRYRLRKRVRPDEALTAAYHEFCEALSRRGFTRERSWGPYAYRDFIVMRALSDVVAAVLVFDTYARLRYGAVPFDARDVASWRERAMKAAGQLRAVPHGGFVDRQW